MASDDGRIWKEFKRSWVLWIILNFSGGMKTLVNQVEQPFARSLVVCDTPLVPGNYTGSKYCGDRLQVLEEGFRISAQGQGKESLAMLCSMGFVVVAIGAFGRKFTVLLGLAGTLLSVLLFVIASTSPEMGKMLFSVGQGLQGLYPVEYIFGIVVLDISTQAGADGEATHQVKFVESIVGVFIWFSMGFAAQLAELTDYQNLWIAILALNSGMLALAIANYPETRPTAIAPQDDVGPIGKMILELKGFRGVFEDFRARRYLFKMALQNIALLFGSSMIPVQLMAYHGWTQPFTVTFMILQVGLGILCIPLYDRLIRRFGYHNTYCATIIFLIFIHDIPRALVAPFSGKIAGFISYMIIPVFGFFPLREFVDSRFCEPEQFARFKTLQMIIGYVQGVFILPVYSWLFRAEATTYVGRSMPNFLAVAVTLVHAANVFFGIYSMKGEEGPEGFGITVQQLDEIRAKGAQTFALLGEGWKKMEAADSKAEESQTEEQKKEALVATASKAWEDSGMRDIFGGKTLQELGGPFADENHFDGFLRGFNTSPKAARALILQLDKAIASAAKWAGVDLPPAADKPVSKDEKKKA